METKPTSVTQGLADVALHRIKATSPDAAKSREIGEKYLDRIENVSHDEQEKKFITAAREVLSTAQSDRMRTIVLARTLQQVSLGVAASQSNSPLATSLVGLASGVSFDIGLTRHGDDATMAEARQVGQRLAYTMETHAPNDEVKQLSHAVLSMQDAGVSDRSAVNAQVAGMMFIGNAFNGEHSYMRPDNWLGLFGHNVTGARNGNSLTDRLRAGDVVLRYIMTHTPNTDHAVAARHALDDAKSLPLQQAVDVQRAALRQFADEPVEESGATGAS